MRPDVKLILCAAALAALGACGDSDEGRGGLTAEEERQLDNAAEMLDGNMVDASPDSLVANEAEFATEPDNGAEPDNVAEPPQ